MGTLAEYASNRRALWEDERDGGIYGAGAHHVVGTIDLRFRNDSGAHHVGAHHVVGTIDLRFRNDSSSLGSSARELVQR